jgi:predicted nucleotidyltransferase component of viral defense system
MAGKEIKDITESIRGRLKNIARETKRDFDAILLQFFQERFLYRLSVSEFRENFILKGALLLMIKSITPFRPTKDIDFLGRGIGGDANRIKTIFKKIADISGGDSVHFESEDVEVQVIMKAAEYVGVRVKMNAAMGNIRKKMTMDVGFGDMLIDELEEFNFPVLLNFPSPKIRCYSFETVIAEKFQAMVWLNFQTSRLKDFFDIFYLAGTNTFMSKRLIKVLNATLKKRDTDKIQRNVIFSEEFKNEKMKQIQWAAFLRKNRLPSEQSFAAVVEKIQQFLEPLFDGSLENDTLYLWDKEEWKWVTGKESD